MARVGLFISMVVVEVDEDLALAVDGTDKEFKGRVLQYIRDRINNGELKIQLPFPIRDASKAY